MHRAEAEEWLTDLPNVLQAPSAWEIPMIHWNHSQSTWVAAAARMCVTPCGRAVNTPKPVFKLGPLDDPVTPENESYSVGVCLPSDCNLGTLDCRVDQVCRPYTLWSRAGRCELRGPVIRGGSCESHSDCSDSAQCVHGFAGRVCMELCGDGLQGCSRGSLCRTDLGLWILH